MIAARPKLWEMCSVESSPSRVVYRRGSRPRLGGIILGFSLVAGIAILSTGIIDRQSDLGPGAFVLVISFISGLWLISDQRVALDKSTMQLTRSWRLLGTERSATEQIVGVIDSVGWAEKRDHSSGMYGSVGNASSTYEVHLLARDDEHPEPQMYNLLKTEREDEARRLAAEVAGFLGLDGEESMSSSAGGQGEA